MGESPGAVRFASQKHTLHHHFEFGIAGWVGVVSWDLAIP
jgi:hypothetical protein